MRRTVLRLALGIAGVCAMPQPAQAWSEGTHAYIADHLGKSYGLRNLNEIYGAMAPDLFNLKQFDPAFADLYMCGRAHTHGFIPENVVDFMNVWAEAGWGFSRNAAYGYLTHNDVWGADVAAHWDGLTNEADQTGWVMEKARELIEIYGEQGLWAALEIEPYQQDLDPWMFQPAELLCQYLVMRAGDLIIKRKDPLIGAKMAAAALLRAPDFNDVLVDAISCIDGDTVSAAELEFQAQTITLGLLLLQSEETYLDAITAQTAALGPAFLAAYGAPWSEEKQALIVAAIRGGLDWSLLAVEDDYMTEVDAMIAYLKAEMSKRVWFY